MGSGRLRDWNAAGLAAAKPAATAVDEGFMYYETDNDLLYRSDGSTWVAVGSASAQVATHEAAGDPHPGYRLESADHDHSATGAQGGTIDHADLTNVTADQHHTQAHDHSSADDGVDLNPEDIDVQHALLTSGVVTEALTAQADDWAPTGLADAAVIRVSADADYDITGLTGGAAGRHIFILNTDDTDTLTLTHEDASSTAANRFDLPGGSSVDIGPRSSVHLIYDAVSERWRLAAGAGSGGGGGASAIDDLTDVDTDKSKTPADGDVLTFDGTDWNAETPSGGGGASDLGDLGDVTVTGSETDGQVLTSDGLGGFAFEDVAAAGMVSSVGCDLQATSFSTSHATWYLIEMDIENRDDNGWHDLVTNPERVTVDADGWYLATAGANWDPDATGLIAVLYLRKNGTTIDFAYGDSPDGNQPMSMKIARLVYLEAGDYLELRFIQYANKSVDLTDIRFQVAALAGGGGGTATGDDFELAYVEGTSDVNVTSTTEASGDTVISSGAVTYDGATPVLVEFFAPYVYNSNNRIWLSLWEGSTQIGRMTVQANDYENIRATYRFTPTAGSHTYVVKAHCNAGSGVVVGGSGGVGTYLPHYIRIIRANPVVNGGSATGSTEVATGPLKVLMAERFS